MKRLIYVTIVLFFVQAIATAQEGRSSDVWFGTANSGIYRSSFSQDAGQLTKPWLIVDLPDTGWVSQETNGRLYATARIDGKPSVISFPIDLGKSGQVTQEVDSQPIEDGGSCFVTLDHTGKMLISAQYGGGSVAVFPIKADGTLGPRSQLIEHQGGSKVVGNRQNSPHPHYVAISPDNRFAFVPDLGLDQVIAYEIDLKNQKLKPHNSVDVISGGGPRHMKFHPNGKFAFVLNELTSSVTVFSYNAESGQLKKLATVAALSDAEMKQNDFNSASEIRVHPSGKCIVSANRGHDSLSVFRFDEETGKLERTQNEPVRGSFPRNFSFSPDGDKLLAAGRDSNTISVFQVDSENCLIRYIQKSSKQVPTPICISFPAKR